MRKLITVLGMVGIAGLSAVSSSQAAPVAGYDGLYDAVISSCSLPAGTVDTCSAAITAYAGALINDGVAIEVANQSFSEARLEVFALNAADEEFQAVIDALFEELLPDSGAIGGGAAAGAGDTGPSIVEGGTGAPAPVDPSPVL